MCSSEMNVALNLSSNWNEVARLFSVDHNLKKRRYYNERIEI
jgi:hypothetical protein